MEKHGKIYIAGHRGMVGSAIHRKLLKDGYTNFVLKDSNELDLRDQKKVARFFKSEKPDYVFLAAAKVGGIHANNTYRAEFIYDNLLIQSNVIHQSYLAGVKKLLFLGSSCIYPKYAGQPIREDALLTGELEITNEPYAIAKIAGIKMCQAYHAQYGCRFVSVMPSNLYGPNDNYSGKDSHVIPALIHKFFEAKMKELHSVEIWGSGNPKREFTHVDDLADACLLVMNEYESPEIINVGTGVDWTIKEVALMIREAVRFEGDIYFNQEYPDGTPRKLLDNSKINFLGWSPKIKLKDGIKEVCDQYASTAGYSLENVESHQT
jgi:GDP-L-fucose synthase